MMMMMQMLVESHVEGDVSKESELLAALAGGAEPCCCFLTALCFGCYMYLRLQLAWLK